MRVDPRPPEQLLAEIKELGQYIRVKYLPDGSVAAMGGLMFTTAIYLGCTLWGWDRRFCYESTYALEEAWDALLSENDEPVGWIARRGG